MRKCVRFDKAVLYLWIAEAEPETVVLEVDKGRKEDWNGLLVRSS